MNKDYYNILGIQRNATADDIKRAYRKAAAQHHPDRGGSTEKFQEIEEAYRVLSDPQQKHQYDHPQQQNPFFNFSQGGAHFGGDFVNINNIFEQMFRNVHQRNNVMTYRTQVWITLEQVLAGGEQVLHLQTNHQKHVVRIEIPRGIDDGATIRYDNLIPNAHLLVEFRTHKHLKYERVGADLHTNVKINVLHLITGTTIKHQTIEGTTLDVSIPPSTQPSAAIKIAGYGLPRADGRRGDCYLNVKAFVPTQIPQHIIESIRKENIN